MQILVMPIQQNIYLKIVEKEKKIVSQKLALFSVKYNFRFISDNSAIRQTHK